MLKLTTAQQDIYLEGKLFGRSLNNIGGYERFRCELDVTRFIQARSILFQENDAYRLRFRESEGDCVPFVSDSFPAALPVIDFPTEASALAWIQEQFELPFANIAEAVFEDTLIRISSNEYWYFAKAHHLIMDGWGFALQMQQFVALYERLANRGTHTVKPGPSFIDYMSRQADYRKSDQYARSRDYWLLRHEGTSGPLIAPKSGHMSPGGSHRISMVLDAGLMCTLRHAAAGANANMVALMYSALYVYFSRSYQRNDVTICSPVHNRRNAADKATIGSIVNVNAHRLTARADATFQQLMMRIALIQRQDYRHSQFPLGDLVRAVRERSKDETNPLCEISFNYQKLDFQLAIHDQVVETHYLSHSHERLPLTLVLCEYGKDQDVRLHLDYALSHFDEHEATALMDRLLLLLQQIAEDDTRPICDYALLREEEWRRQFSIWQGPCLPLRDGACLHEFFEDQVTRTPDSIAAICGDVSLSYVELNDRANRLAGHLIEEGVAPGQLVGICHGRSLDLLVSMLAVLKSGAAYVPIDPAYPPTRVQYILDDSQVTVVIADARGSETLEATERSVIRTDTIDTGLFLREQKLPNPDRRQTALSSEDIAYVIYTSGSTGEPKGVLIEHRNASAFVQWALSQFTAEELSCVLAGTSICFDLSLFELFVPLAAGGRIRLVDNVLALQSDDMDDLSLINTVPSAIRGLLDADAIPSSIRCVNLAGELLKQELVDALYARLGSAKVYDLYGPSETTTYSTFGLRTRGGETTIGQPIANTQAYVFDERGNPLPTGMIGELYIGGAGVSRGYLNRPAQTADKFALNPHTGTRLYRTGDLVRLAADGRLRYVGRKDGQEKIRGHRVETGEIEAFLFEHPLIADCAVVACAPLGGPDHKVLVAYFVETDAREASNAPRCPLAGTELADFLGRRLPAYMVPSHFVALAVLPLTPNGKVDRRALPMPSDVLPHNVPYVWPASDIERRLSSLWESVLKQDRIGTHDSFFSRGGDSLLLLKLAAAIEGEFDVRIDISLLFASHSIEAQARLLAPQLELSHLLRTVSANEDSPSDSFVDL